jgi:hypothetical protein
MEGKNCEEMKKKKIPGKSSERGREGKAGNISIDLGLLGRKKSSRDLCYNNNNNKSINLFSLPLARTLPN